MATSTQTSATATEQPLSSTAVDQPTSSHQAVAYEQPLATPHRGTGTWTNSLFSCLSGGMAANDYLCLKGFFVPCFVYGKQQARLRDPSLANYERVNGDCFTFVCGGWIATFIKRTDLRERYNIAGHSYEDCMTAAFCGHCALIQQEKEILGRQKAEMEKGEGDRGREGYVRTDGMKAERSSV